MTPKNKSEKAHDRKYVKVATENLSRSLDSFFEEAEDHGASGYFDCAYMLVDVRNKLWVLKETQRQLSQKFVAESGDTDVDWSVSTPLMCYRRKL